MRRTLLPCLVTALAALAGCSKLIGLDDFRPALDGSGGAGGAAGTGGTAGAGGSGVAGSSGVGGASGAGGAMECSPGNREACYSGPAGTENVGICKRGQQFCDQHGVWSTCEGEQPPTVEDCGDATKDENCDRYECGIWGFVYGQSSGAPIAQAGRPDGGLVVVGNFAGGLQIGGQNRPAADDDFYVAALDSRGRVEWVYTVASPGLDAVFSAGVSDTGDTFATVATTNAVDLGGGMEPAGTHLVRLTGAGDFVASTFLGPAIVPGLRVLDGSVYVAGGYNGTIDWGTGSRTSEGLDIVVAKLTLDGSVGNDGWVRTLGSPMAEQATSVDVDQLGAVYFGGYVTGPVDFGGGAEFFRSKQDAFLAKLDAAGSFVDALTLSGVEGTEATWGVGVDPTGDVVMIGTYDEDLSVKGRTLTTNGSYNVFLIKYAWEATAFGQRWGVGLPGAQVNFMGAVPFDGDRPVVCATAYAPLQLGTEVVQANGNGTPFAVRLDADGNHRWHRSFGATDGGSAIGGCARSPYNEVFVLGLTSSPTLDIGTGTITAGQGKSFVVKLGR